MEAVWTRYFPLSIYVRKLITDGRLGPIHRVSADLSMPMVPETFDNKHRMVNLDLAGGALLDLGIYALTWCFQTLYTVQDPKTRKAPKVVSSMEKYATGADEMTTMLLAFPRSKEQGGDAHALATCSMRVASDPTKTKLTPAVRVQGSKGEIQIFPPIFRPTKTKLILSDGTVEEKSWPQPGPGKESGWENGFADMRNEEGEGHGMFWEADEAGMALVEGRKEGKFEGWEESVTIMEVMDEVRKQSGLEYPEAIETTDFPVDLP
jgi:dihydrodiol dehydrogenase / D-xylose 1-dehydrogenase (NADP)